MNIVHVVSEMFPYIKTGGLADTVGSLARGLARQDHQVTVFLPGYRTVLEHGKVAPRLRKIQRLRIEMGDIFMTGDVREISPEPNLKIYLVCREEFFDRRLPYGNGERDYEDNHHRFIFFCKAVVEVMRRADIEADVVHGHDWPAGLLPLFLRAAEERHRINLAVRTVHTIHHIAFQGLFPMPSFHRTNLPDELMGIDGVEYYGQASMMKAGIQFADRITTVSPNHAREILTPDFSCGLEGVVQLRVDDLSGRINGIDRETWNPATDPLLPGHYTADDLAGKKLCRTALLQAHGFDPEFKGVVMGMVVRWAEQKGVELLLANAAFFARARVRLIVLSPGAPSEEASWRDWAAQSPDKVKFSTVLDESMNHLVKAGSDFFLMPRLAEPCGLMQMHAQGYGSIPVATRVGGLVDTIWDIEEVPEQGTGILVEPSAAGIAAGLERAMALYAQRSAYAEVQQRAMALDFSWEQAVGAYEAFYQDIV